MIISFFLNRLEILFFINTLNEKYESKKALLCVEKSIINSVFIVFSFVFGVKSLDKERTTLEPIKLLFFVIKSIKRPMQIEIKRFDCGGRCVKEIFTGTKDVRRERERASNMCVCARRRRLFASFYILIDILRSRLYVPRLFST